MATKPVIDYTNKDFTSLKRAMMELARYRLPEWTDQTPTDLGVLMVDLFAYMGDVVLYYQDRIANESFLHTAAERRSVMHLLRLIGYELRPPVAAAADLTLTFNAPGDGEPTTTTVPQGATFNGTASDDSQQSYQYLGADLNIDLTSDQVTESAEGQFVYTGLPVRHSKSVATEILGSSTGEPNQAFLLAKQSLIPESLTVEINEGAGWAVWERREGLLYHRDVEGRVLLSGPEDRAYYVQFDEEGDAWVTFGDGVYGRRPPIGANNIRASYRVGGGAVGNVPAGAIAEAQTEIDYLDVVTNPAPAAGGSDAETTEHGVQFGPLAFRSGLRAVTLDDYVALAHKAGGVAKVRARSVPPNRVDLFVAPEGDTCRPVPDDLRKRLIAYFEDMRMAGTIVYVKDSICVEVEINVDVVAAHHYDPEEVRQSVQAAVEDLLAFENVSFGRPVYLSKVYEAIEALDGVHAVTVTRFRRTDKPTAEVQAVLDEFGVATVDDLPLVVRNALQVEIAPNGRIEMGDYEIPSLGVLSVTVQEVES